MAIVFESINSGIDALKVLRGTFLDIWHIQIQIYPQASIEAKYGAFYLSKEVNVHGLVLLI